MFDNLVLKAIMDENSLLIKTNNDLVVKHNETVALYNKLRDDYAALYKVAKDLEATALSQDKQIEAYKKVFGLSEEYMDKLRGSSIYKT